jgi:ankyrin repeat protein
MKGDEELALYLLPFLKEDEVDGVFTSNGLDAGTILHAACAADMTEVVKRLVMEHNANVDALDHLGHKAICKALGTKRDGGALRFLMDHYTALGRKEEMLGSSCCQQTIEGLNLLCQAIQFGSLEAVIYLVKDLGEDLAKEHFIGDDGERGFSMLPHHWATINQFGTVDFAHKEKFEWLVTEGGAPVDMMTSARQTSLHIICSKGNPKIENHLIATAKFLINEGKMTNVCSRDVNGMTASACALQKGYQSLHDYLLLEEKARDVKVRH